jgi:voltage-gated potassium channel
MLRAVLRNVVVAGALLAMYFAAPVPRDSSITPLKSVLFILGVAAFAAVTMALVGRARFPAEDGPDIRLEVFVLLAYGIIVFFSLTYLGLARDAGEFDGLKTHLDALYFTIVTMATVGYGDVHPVGQAARAATTIQVVFDVVFLAAAVKVLAPVIDARRAARRGAKRSPDEAS